MLCLVIRKYYKTKRQLKNKLFFKFDCTTKKYIIKILNNFKLFNHHVNEI